MRISRPLETLPRSPRHSRARRERDNSDPRFEIVEAAASENWSRAGVAAQLRVPGQSRVGREIASGNAPAGSLFSSLAGPPLPGDHLKSRSAVPGGLPPCRCGSTRRGRNAQVALGLPEPRWKTARRARTGSRGRA